MSPRAAKIRDHAVNAVLSMLATLFLLFGTGAWSLKENASDHNHDVMALAAKLDRILDAVCDARELKPRTCTENSRP